MEDRLLIIRLNCSSKQAFAELYRKYAGKIYNYVLAMTRDDIIAEDITQFCFMKLWEHRTGIKHNENFLAWLYTTARNAVYKETIRNVNSQAYIEYVLHFAELCTESNMEQVNFGILKEEIDKVIASLPESRRLIYALSCEEHMSNVEIAQRLDISVKTVETQLGRVTKALREHLKKFV